MSLSLLTIPFSHYNDMARWALELNGESFREVPFLPGVHMFFSPASRLRKEAGSKGAALPLLIRRRGVFGREVTVEALDSWAILERWEGGGAPLPPRVKELLNGEVGPAARAVVYSHLLGFESKGDFDPGFWYFCRPPVPWWQRLIFGLKPFRLKVADKMRSSMVRNAEHVEQTRTCLRAALDELGALLPALPQEGASPTRVVVAVAAILAPITMPAGLGESFYGASAQTPLEAMPESLRAEVEEWRKHPTVAWALEAYDTHRSTGKQR
mmetsp:Transcript_6806/g.22588  ORF Transcript_6806/g.22588 Transcript_6806/m.22588 type:complete len:269 (-) Transcript_6806:248-1054(-)